MKGIRTLIDIGFFLAIMGWIVHPFVNDALSREQPQTDRAATTPQAAMSPDESFESKVKEASESGQSQGQQFTLPTLTIDGSGRNVAGLVLDGDRVQLATLGAEVRRRRVKRLRLRGNPDIAHQVIMDIKHLCGEAGVESFEDVRFRQSSTL